MSLPNKRCLQKQFCLFFFLMPGKENCLCYANSTLGKQLNCVLVHILITCMGFVIYEVN